MNALHDIQRQERRDGRRDIAVRSDPAAGESFDAAAITGVDLSGVETPMELVSDDLRRRGVTFALADTYGPLRDSLARAGAFEALGANALFPSVDAAVRAHSATSAR